MNIATDAIIPIIIVNWNGFRDTLECVDSVLSMSYKNILIVIIDNNSLHEEGAKLTNFYKDNNNIKVITNEQNIGFCAANIVAYNYLKSKSIDFKWLCLLNNDTIVDKFWLENLLKFVKESKCHIISSKMIQYHDRTLMDNAGHFILNTGEILPIGYGDNINNHTLSKPNIGCCGGAAFYNHEMIKTIGFFDEYFVNGYEDAEFSYRAFLSGYQCVYNPEAIVYHKGGNSISKVFDEAYAIKTQKDIIYTYLKLNPLAFKILNFPFFFFRYILAMIVFLLLGKMKYFKIYASAISSFFKKGHKPNKKGYQFKIGAISFLKNMRFFLFWDLKRFFNLIFSNKPTALDSY